jgi:hypothetical protein
MTIELVVHDLGRVTGAPLCAAFFVPLARDSFEGLFAFLDGLPFFLPFHVARVFAGIEHLPGGITFLPGLA